MKLYDNDAYRDEFMEFVYDLLRSDGTNDRANLIIDKFDSVPEVEAEPLLSNEPLTLEDLREMDGEPIYITGIGWKICYGVDESTAQSGIVTGLTTRLYLSGYGETWMAYRHKPEEGTNATT